MINTIDGLLLKPYTINGKLEIKNRIVMAPFYVGRNFFSPTIQSFFLRRAQGGVGLLIVPIPTFGGIEELLSPEFIEKASVFTQACHAYHCKVVPQIFSGAGEKVNEFSQSELEAIPEQFAQALLQMKKAGFDGIEIHGAHHSLFMHLLSPLLNKRRDEYGNTFENKSRLQIQTVKAMRAVDQEFPIFFRFSASDLVPDSVDLSLTVPYAKMLEAAGADCLDISVGGTAASPQYSECPNETQPEGCFAPLFGGIKQNVNIPVIGVGKILSRQTAETILNAGQADLIALGRPLVSDPDWPNKILNGLDAEILPADEWDRKLPKA